VAIEFGVAARAEELSVRFNRMWAQKLDRLERELGIVVFRFDFFQLIDDMLDTAGMLGFTNVTESCLAVIDQGLCDLDRFSFINELLPTARVHEFFGSALAEALVQQVNALPRRPGNGRKWEIRPYSVVVSTD
jgi:phospholipase/lecithinase/hemolysin